jgi:hypothetical protein
MESPGIYAPAIGRIVTVFLNGYDSFDKCPAIVLSNHVENPTLQLFGGGLHIRYPIPSIQFGVPHKKDAQPKRMYWDWPETPPNCRP